MLLKIKKKSWPINFHKRRWGVQGGISLKIQPSNWRWLHYTSSVAPTRAATLIHGGRWGCKQAQKDLERGGGVGRVHFTNVFKLWKQPMLNFLTFSLVYMFSCHSSFNWVYFPAKVIDMTTKQKQNLPIYLRHRHQICFSIPDFFFFAFVFVVILKVNFIEYFLWNWQQC